MKNITKGKSFVNHIEISINIYFYVCFHFYSKHSIITVSITLLEMKES